MALVRLNKYIANTGFCSRREADALIADGKVRVNAQPVTELGFKVDDEDPTLQVSIGKKMLRATKTFTYVALHKPKGYTVTKRDPHAERTIYDLLPKTLHHVLPVGRLDKDSEGLLLLTNDGDLIQAMTHPSFQKTKRYIVQTKQPLTIEQLAELREGVDLTEGNTGKNFVKQIDDTTFEIALTQGWNRQIRRMVGTVGGSVKRLQRVQVGKVHLGALPKGKWQVIQKNHIV